jgi:hypothetical protein
VGAGADVTVKVWAVVDSRFQEFCALTLTFCLAIMVPLVAVISGAPALESP